MTDTIHEHFFAEREAASVAAAAFILDSLAAQLQSEAATSLVVTGGSSPTRCYTELAASEINWSAVQVTLSDERWVPPTDSSSNEKLVRESLLTDHAKDAQLLPFYAEDCTPAERCQQLKAALSALPTPFACALLGMGTDGHFASLFPDAENLDAGLDAGNTDWCMPIETAASGHTRISLTLAALLRSKAIVLLFFGDAKREIYEQAGALTADVPVAKLLSQTSVPVHVFWAA